MTFESGARRSGALMVMRVVSVLELVSLVVILTNRFTIHSPAITSSGGPIHGLLYASTILLALLLPFPRSAKWLSAVPGFGGLLAIWQARRVFARTRAHVNPAPAQNVALREADRAGAVIVADAATASLSRTTTIGPLSFTVPRGGITGLIGPNGAGKTTALRMMCGLVAVTGGSITPTYEEAAKDAAAGMVTPPIGVLIDSPGFIPGLTGRENLLALTRLAGWPSTLADRALDRVGLSSSANQRIGTFSLGMKQRLGLATALLGGPRIVILDEPTNGLDPRGTLELRGFLRSLAEEGITVIIASHALDEIEELCDHVVVMDHGSVFFNGPPARMLETIPRSIRCTPDDPATLKVLVEAFERDGCSVTALDDAAALVLGDAALGGRLNQIASDAGITLSEISPQRPTLQDAFLALTGNTGATDTGVKQAETMEVAR